ncbi:MAG TPA: trypsin-like peptidase domain-containing protein [Gaiellaceae bacterium]|nr:trypsin-like peptidase domain-containing protein [Gaiellaceae bacterium]
MPGLTRRLLLAVLATLLAPAVAASPAGATGHSAHAVKAGPNVGIVDIYTTLGYEDGRAAGTGMIISRSGEVLTNNHVISGATKFKVVDVTTHRKYSATVVGYSVSRDVAVLQLAHASGLRTVKRGGAIPLHVNMRVVARGNAQGRGGPPKSAPGRIIALHQQIVAKDEAGDPETLNNLIATNAPVVPGYSGGPLQNSQNRVLGIVTAGSTSGAPRGFAIPLGQALRLARQIEAGRSSAVVHVGPTAFLGVLLQDVSSGAKVWSVVPGKPADVAGLTKGDIITSLDGTTVSSRADVRNVVLSLVPGTAVPIGWTDASGAAQTGTITPISGPPQ